MTTEDWGPGRIADFTATVITDKNGSPQCTIHPRDVADQDEATAWVTAESDGFCSTDEIR